MKKKNLIKKASVLVLSFTMLTTSTLSFGHSGRTDGSGGHRDNKNKSGLGSYHYHCGGNPAHLHKNGVCPYSGKAKSTSKSSSTKSSSNSNIKAVQTKLNSLGYNCGTPDGVAGAKTKNAIRAFQKKQGLQADGVAGPATRKALGL